MRHGRHNTVWNSRIYLNFGLKHWLCWPSLSALWRKCGRPVLSSYFGLCAVFPLFLLSGAMMLEKQYSLLWDFLVFKTYFEVWKNKQSFFLKKTPTFFILTTNIPRRSISISQTPQYFSRFPFFLTKQAHSCSQSLPVLVHLSISSKKITHHVRLNLRSDRKLWSLCNFILICDWLHIKGPLSGSHWYLLR